MCAVLATQHSSGEVVDQRDRITSLIGLAACSTCGVVGGGLDAIVLIAGIRTRDVIRRLNRQTPVEHVVGVGGCLVLGVGHRQFVARRFMACVAMALNRFRTANPPARSWRVRSRGRAELVRISPTGRD